MSTQTHSGVSQVKGTRGARDYLWKINCSKVSLVCSSC